MHPRKRPPSELQHAVHAGLPHEAYKRFEKILPVPDHRIQCSAYPLVGLLGPGAGPLQGGEQHPEALQLQKHPSRLRIHQHHELQHLVRHPHILLRLLRIDDVQQRVHYCRVLQPPLLRLVLLRQHLGELLQPPGPRFLRQHEPCNADTSSGELQKRPQAVRPLHQAALPFHDFLQQGLQGGPPLVDDRGIGGPHERLRRQRR
mmetsp:Transcript_33797/g.87863  ORF Transcript_33797/g.87863 Transcript_33797/m.87863 type:complete len:203 (-) Transcript_33797:263-871(-)